MNNLESIPKSIVEKVNKIASGDSLKKFTFTINATSKTYLKLMAKVGTINNDDSSDMGKVLNELIAKEFSIRVNKNELSKFAYNWELDRWIENGEK